MYVATVEGVNVTEEDAVIAMDIVSLADSVAEVSLLSVSLMEADVDRVSESVTSALLLCESRRD